MGRQVQFSLVPSHMRLSFAHPLLLLFCTALPLQMVCQGTTARDERIRIASFTCLHEIAANYYAKLPAYMGEIFNISVKAIQEDSEEVGLQAVEFWSTLCDIELDLADEDDPQEVGAGGWAGLGCDLGKHAWREQLAASAPSNLDSKCCMCVCAWVCAHGYVQQWHLLGERPMALLCCCPTGSADQKCAHFACWSCFQVARCTALFRHDTRAVGFVTPACLLCLIAVPGQPPLHRRSRATPGACAAEAADQAGRGPGAGRYGMEPGHGQWHMPGPAGAHCAGMCADVCLLIQERAKGRASRAVGCQGCM